MEGGAGGQGRGLLVLEQLERGSGQKGCRSRNIPPRSVQCRNARGQEEEVPGGGTVRSAHRNAFRVADGRSNRDAVCGAIAGAARGTHGGAELRANVRAYRYSDDRAADRPSVDRADRLACADEPFV